MRIVPLVWNASNSTFDVSAPYADFDFILYFAGRGEILADSTFASLRAAFPGALILGCSTGTPIGGVHLVDDAAVAVAVKLDSGRVRLVSAAIRPETGFEVGASLAQELRQHANLVGLLVLSVGLAVNGSALVDGLQSVLGPDVPIGGGLAGDGAAFERTYVAADAPPKDDVVAALGFYGDGVKIGLGAAHGWDYFGPTRRITRSSGGTLFELDGKPALELYERYLGDEFAEMPSAALRYPLLISEPNKPANQVVRTVLSVDDNGALQFAGDVPEGWTARLMRGSFINLASGAEDAARRAGALAFPPDGERGLALLVSCVGRRLLMGPRAEDEIETVANILSSQFHQIGFYSYGEISTEIGESGYCGLHNQTMTVFTLSEAA